MTWMDMICAAILLVIIAIALFGIWAGCTIQREEDREKEARHAEG